MNGVRAIGWSLDSPATGAGAVAVVRLQALNAAEMDRALAELGLGTVAAGTIQLRNLLGVDEGLIARWNGESAFLMPHGGQGVIRALGEQLLARDIPQHERADARAVYPEALNQIEAEMLLALSQAPSSLAIDLLLHQPKRWGTNSAVSSDPGSDRVLNRLIVPPLVVAIGPSNIGKSTLANALAGRGVSIVADEPGTTRDHVGVMLDLAGLVVRYVDTPGIRAGAPEVESQASAIALQLAKSADLILLCSDSAGPESALPWAHESRSNATSSNALLRIALRSDLASPAFKTDCAVSVKEPESIAKLVALTRETLVPRKLLDDPRPWKFWDRSVQAGAAS